MRTMMATLLLSGLFGATVAAQAIPSRPPALPAPTAGAELYQGYCASCHGLDARGRPAASSGQRAAPDLATLARQHDGRFPRDEVRALIVNGGTRGSVHASSAMPKWGPIFRAVAGDDGKAGMRMESLLDYLQRLQESAGRSERSH